MKYILVGYNQDFSWVHEYTDDYLLYDRSETDEFIKDFPPERVIKTENIGNADYDRLGYLVDNYDDLPEVFLWSKANLFQYMPKEQFDLVCGSEQFTPLLSNSHKTYLPICYYEDGMYHELNNSWYLQTFPAQYKTYNEFAEEFNLPTPEYLAFAPGGNYILTKERVHRHPKELYKALRDTLSYTKLPGEAQFIERTYYTLWK